MPTYTYRCKSCSHQFDEWQKMSDKPLLTCPSCKNDALVRIIGGGGGLIFKGSGFYSTDYKKTSSKSKKETTEEKNPTSEKKSESAPTASTS